GIHRLAPRRPRSSREIELERGGLRRNHIAPAQVLRPEVHVPEISRFLGIVVKLYFQDHQPPHFHARYGEYPVKVLSESGGVEGRFPPRALRNLREWSDPHPVEPMQDGLPTSRGEPPFPIPPLE